jgi:RNA polymerase sigma factor (sigma-70 family)
MGPPLTVLKTHELPAIFPPRRDCALITRVQLDALDDARLVARCRSGDQEAWRELVNRFSRYVYAICSQAFRLRQDDAEDVFQEVFARTYQYLERLRDDEAIRPWIGQLTRRLCIDRLRASAREELSGEEVEPAGADETIEQLDEALTVHEALATLPENCREILDRFFARDESYQTIGAALDIPAGTIASRISRCLGKLRELLEGRKPTAEPSS